MTDLLYTQDQIAHYGRICADDFFEIKRCRRPHNRLGFAYQLGFVRLFGRFPAQRPLERVDDILAFVSLQISIDHQLFEKYVGRRETIAEHQERIRKYLGYRRFSADFEVEEFVFEQACRLEQVTAIMACTKEYLRAHKILIPANDTLHRLVQIQREAARTHVYARITGTLTLELKQVLDELLATGPGRRSILYSLKQPARRPSSVAIQGLTEKLQRIEKTGALGIDLGWLNKNFQRSLGRHAHRCSAKRLRELGEDRRYATLICYLQQLHSDTLDELVNSFDKLMSRMWNQADIDQAEHTKGNRRQIRASLGRYRSILGTLFDEVVEDAQFRKVVFGKYPEEELQREVDELNALLDGKFSHVFKLFVGRHSYFRQFSPMLLQHLKLSWETGLGSDLLEAIDILRLLNEDGRRKLPDTAPDKFVSKALRPLVFSDETADKPAWECALLLAVRDEIKQGNLFVFGSKRFASLDDFFIPEASWQAQREEFFERAGLPSRAEDVEAYLTGRLNRSFDDFLGHLPENTSVKIDEEGWRLSSDPATDLDHEAESRLKRLKKYLAERMRVIKLPQMLIEVDNELHITRPFMTAAQREKPEINHVREVLTTIMAHGCNIGPYTMAHLVDGVSYSRIKHITDWMLNEQTQRSALATVVNGISRLEVTSAWGEGRTSSSDGQRFSLKQRVLQQTYSPRFKDFAIEFYSFVADNYAPFYSAPIECTDRDAPHVLDGLLYNESDLPLEEHYTDTHGYTENNFSAFAMLGRRFAPRIKGMHKQRVYRIDEEKDYGPLSSLVGRKDRTIHLDWIKDQWDRLGHFYASLEQGHATASVAMKRLNGFSGKNRFYRANRELGRIFKTEHILRYMSDPRFRRRIRHGLLKGEQIHSLARDLNYGKRGQLAKRDWLEQRNGCSCLTLILASIIYWQAREIGRVLDQIDFNDPETKDLDISLVEHISPIAWNNVILYGEYVLRRDLIQL